MKFILLVEGQTERKVIAEFLKRWLDPQLQHAIGIQTVSFDGYADLVRKMATKTEMHLKGPKSSEVVAVVALLDLYGPTFYPPHLTNAEERILWGKEHFEKQIGHSKFRFFFAVHEIEAWLLSQPEIFSRDVTEALPAKVVRPEKVNFDEPPAKLLDRVYRQTVRRTYKKTAYGTQLFKNLDPNVAAAKCPWLKAMLDEMLALAKGAGL
jgi:hypothetical protein